MKPIPQRNLRKEISDALFKRGKSIRQLSIEIEYDYSNLVAYLNNRRTLPEKYLERALAILKL